MSWQLNSSSSFCLLLIAPTEIKLAPGLSAGPAAARVGHQKLALSRLDCDQTWPPWCASFCCRGAGVTARSTRGLPQASVTGGKDVDDVLETPPTGKKWIVLLLPLLDRDGELRGQASGLRFILFPPLVVIAYEMFAHPAT